MKGIFTGEGDLSVLLIGNSLFLAIGCETNHNILRLAEYRFIYEKIDNNRIPSKCRFWSSNFVSQNETTLTDKNYQILKNNIKICVDSNLSFTYKFELYLQNLINFILPTFDKAKSRSKETRYLTMCYTK